MDRALAVVARALGDEPDFEALDCDVSRLADDLALRFDPPRMVRVQ